MSLRDVSPMTHQPFCIPSIRHIYVLYMYMLCMFLIKVYVPLRCFSDDTSASLYPKRLERMTAVKRQATCASVCGGGRGHSPTAQAAAAAEAAGHGGGAAAEGGSGPDGPRPMRPHPSAAHADHAAHAATAALGPAPASSPPDLWR